MASRNNIFTTIRTEGALLPADLLQRISEGATLDGLTPESYHLYPGEKLNEAVNQRWNRLQGVWTSFRAAQERLPENDLGTSITRERWLLPLFDTLGYGRLQTATAVEIEGRSYPISHGWEHVPVHLVSYKLELDRRTPGAAGASTASPHSLLQVFLNRSENNLWGFLSNGYKLRILRDNVSLTRQAYVEFDLEAMMDGEVYSDFVLLWLLCHQSRVEGERLSDCWLEKWMKVAEDQGTRALDQLRDGVEAAITALGLGFLEYPANYALRDQLTNGELNAQDYYRQLLRMVYRLLFLFVAEDRDLLLNPAADTNSRERYIHYYSTQRLRRMAETFKGTRHPDLFEGLRLVMRLLSGDGNGAGTGLGLVPLGSFLFSDRAVTDVIGCQIANSHLLDAIRALSLTYDQRSQVYRTVDYKNLGSDELGSIFESLLELHPQINVPARRFALSTAAGNERKTTGSYYTPESLVHALLDSALNPVLAEATKKGEAAILDLKVCDPACGSGHFLIAAANRLAKALAFVRTGEEEPPPAAIQEAKRDIISHCIYGVDINAMAVELCKVNLWMEALEPGKPLNFLDHRIQVGNSLLGTTPKLMAGGIPDDAFNPIEGDDPKVAATMKKVNKQERKDRETGQRSLFEYIEPPANYRALHDATLWIDRAPDETLAQVRLKEQMYQEMASDPEYVKVRLLADAWCAAFVWEKRQTATFPATFPMEFNKFPPPMTDLFYRRMEENPLAENLQAVREYVVELKERYQFFHWHVAFPDVFTVPEDMQHAENEQTGWHGGFDLIIGNPPWDMIQIDPEEFFSIRAPDIASANRTSDRERLIKQLQIDDPQLYNDYYNEIRFLSGVRNIVNKVGLFPLTSYGRLNIASTFAELFRILINSWGQAGLIVPTGIATDSFNQYFFSDLVESQQIVSLYDFENAVGLFPGIGHGRFKFCLLTLAGHAKRKDKAEFAFFARYVADLDDESSRFTLTKEDFTLFNPNTRTCPIFRSKHDAELTRHVYEVSKVLMNEVTGENPWGLDLKLIFMMNTDSHLFKTMDELVSSNSQLERNIYRSDEQSYLPLYEAKLMYYYDFRYGDYRDYPEGALSSHLPDVPVERLQDPNYSITPRFWLPENEVHNRLDSWKYRWVFTYRAISNSTNERTFIAGIQPLVGLGNSLAMIQFGESELQKIFGLLANLCAFSFDWVVRQKMGGTNMNMFIVKQLPVTPPHTYNHALLDFIVPRVLELTYTAWDLQPFAKDVSWDGAPFIWDEERRFLMRCELDALYFHLYQIQRDEVDYIMETFPIVKRKDIAHTSDENGEGGEYLTKRIILEMYDQMAALPIMHVPAPKDESATYAVPDVSQWMTWLNPPPSDARVAHGG
ncbi:MAG: N-6 DNA methylase [Chloroflexota bacterium]